jgi:hypothetical protein
MEVYGFDSSVSDVRVIVGSFEHGNNLRIPQNIGKFFSYLSDCELLKDDCSPRSWTDS